jgi:dienelactone hydrolase
MRIRTLMIGGLSTVLVAGGIAAAFLQGPAIKPVEEKLLREYAGVYEWAPDAFVYLQIWNELDGTNRLTAFDESGDVRTLYPTDVDGFFAGPGAALSSSVESRVEFQRDARGAIASLAWHRGSAAARTARRVEIERWEDVSFSNGDVQLAGTLIRPSTGTRHPAVILVHYSGPANRESGLPFARFLIRHGIAVLGYDKRGVGASTGDWNTASFDDLASDAVAAFEYLKTRSDIDAAQVGLLGVSQAGWVMPIAAVRAPQFAFLISVSGAGVSGAETMIDHARNEMQAGGMPRDRVEQVLELMKLQMEFARTGRGWEQYMAGRAKLAARMGSPPDNFPGTPDHPWLQFLRPLVAYDPAPTLRQLQVPTLALFGELDNNILATKNKAAWQAALEAGGHPDYTLETLSRANHLQLEATKGTNAEMASLQRFVPAYATTVHQWLAKRTSLRQGFGGPP